jgi:hypothetical protein
MSAMATAQLDPRDQEVVRASKELAAYFRGQRTEREARAALKIIKAFIRERQRTDAARRRPLPGLGRAPEDRPKKAKTAPQRRKRSRQKPAEPNPIPAEPPE